MKKLSLFLSLALVLNLFTTNLMAQNNSMKDSQTPVAAKKPKVLKIHGYEIVDNYAWLRDRNDKKDPEIIKYLEDNNKYTESIMASTNDLQKKLYEEMLGRLKQTDESLPTKIGEYWYYNKTQEGKNYPVYVRRKGTMKAPEEVLLDQNEMAKGYKFYAIGEFSVSEDGNILAFSTDTTGYRQYTLQFKDLRTGKILPNKIERVTSADWANDNNTVFVVTEDAVSKRSDILWKHDVSANKTDQLYQEKDVLFNIGVGKSRDKKVIFLASFAKTSSEYRWIPADNPSAEWKVVLPREEGHEHNVDHYGDMFYIRTKKNAENYRVVSAPMNDPSEKNWKEFIPHNPNILIEGINFFKGTAIVSEVENGLEYLKVMDMNGKAKPYRIPTPEPLYTMGLAGNPEFDTPTVRFGYQSMITPASTYEFNLKTKKSKLLKQQEIPSGYDKNQYETHRAWAVVRDGVKVPLSVVMKKGTKRDGTAPMLLYAYGSYGASMSPTFSIARLSLLDRGMIYVIAHIRGGSELGEKWRQDGRMFKKMNTFNDFVDSAKWLIDNKYTSADRLVIQGGSAGGLLMGAVVNQAPQLFKASICQVPFVDVMNTMLDETLPLTTEEWVEWGNPNEKQAWDYMIQYSPYDNVKAQNYPNMLIEVSLNDSQVPYWEGAKFAAKIREMATNNPQILLKTNMGAGHGGSSGRYDRFKEIAFDYSYALKQVGITQ
jgi:oligopeptidase B